MSVKHRFQPFILGLVVLGVVSTASALPWDQDMWSQESLQSNEVARAPVKGSVPIGRKPFGMSADEADKDLHNPVPPTRDSAWAGERLYRANCLTCHGEKADGRGPVPLSATPAPMPVPNLLDAFYKERSDGRMFAVIQNGGAAMPRYGYKFSDREHWDIINYVRFLQGVKQIPGMERSK